MALDINDPGMESYIDPIRQLIKELKPKTVLEIGMGEDAYSTRIFLAAKVKLATVDKEDWKSWGKKLDKSWKLLKGRSQDILPTLTDRYDLVFIDGDHAYEGVKQDIINAKKLTDHIFVDDYGVNKGVIDIVDWKLVEGDFGVKQAVDEELSDWQQVYKHIEFGNGARVYRKIGRPSAKA